VVGNGEEVSPCIRFPIRKSGGVVSSPSGVRGGTPSKKNLEHIKRHQTPVAEGKLDRETFVTAYIIPRTVIGHPLAKIVPGRYVITDIWWEIFYQRL